MYQLLFFILFVNQLQPVFQHVLQKKNNVQLTPLMKAAQAGDVELLSALVSVDTVNTQAHDGKTALHMAIEASHPLAALFLMQHGANLFIIDNAENTALSLARRQQFSAVIDEYSKLFLSGNHLGKQFDVTDKHFIILIASYNNADWYHNNIKMLCEQKYDKFTAIYMDDMSTDGTLALVQDYIKEYYPHKLKHFIFIQNKVKRYCLGNYIFAIEKFCPDNAVLVTYDGDDWFASKDDLDYLNKLYKTHSSIWLTYGNSIIYPQNRVAPFCKAIPPSLLRQKGIYRNECIQTRNWDVHHLRSFYTWLFRSINDQDFYDEDGNIFSHVEDVAFMLPMLEMAGPNRYLYIKKPLYIYNVKNSLRTDNVINTKEKRDLFFYILNKPAYAMLPTNYQYKGIR